MDFFFYECLQYYQITDIKNSFIIHLMTCWVSLVTAICDDIDASIQKKSEGF